MRIHLLFKSLFFFILFSVPPIFASSHQAFDALLKDHVYNGHVDYAAIGQDPRFNAYLDYLSTAKPETWQTPDAQLAFWINAYNALTIQGILNGLSPSSFFSRIRFFKTEHYRVADQSLTLDEIEHEYIASFKQPLFHFAIVCASASCPKLISEAYHADTLRQQMEANAREFINDSNKNRFELETRTASISKIFDWFEDDFIEQSNSVQQFLAPYVNNPDIAKLLKQQSFTVKYLEYDWSLNGKRN